MLIMGVFNPTHDQVQVCDHGRIVTCKTRVGCWPPSAKQLDISEIPEEPDRASPATIWVELRLAWNELGHDREDRGRGRGSRSSKLKLWGGTRGVIESGRMTLHKTCGHCTRTVRERSRESGVG